MWIYYPSQVLWIRVQIGNKLVPSDHESSFKKLVMKAKIGQLTLKGWMINYLQFLSPLKVFDFIVLRLKKSSFKCSTDSSPLNASFNHTLLDILYYIK